MLIYGIKILHPTVLLRNYMDDTRPEDSNKIVALQAIITKI